MPANIESMFSVRQMPWHREGTILADYPGDWNTARKLAGLDWDPVNSEVYAVTGINADGSAHYEPVPGWKSVIRSDTGAVLSLNRDTYTVIDHGEMGEIVEAVLAQPNVKWETAGVLDAGRSVWCLALLDEPITLPGDDSATLPYLAITNRHDGTAACALRATAADRLREHLPRRRTRRRAHRGDVLLHPQVKLAVPHRGSPPRRDRRAGRDAPLQRPGPRAAGHPRQPRAAGAVHHRVHSQAPRGADH